MTHEPNGAFDARHAQRKQWKVDPGLMRALSELLPPQEPRLRVVDIGAGAGHYVHALREMGHHAAGVDGTAGVETLSGGLVLQYDLTRRIHWRPPADWAMCIEVGEHIPAELSPQFLDNLARAATQGLIVSWATPGQRGRGHVHCQPPEWVVAQLERRGWRESRAATKLARDMAQGGWRRKLLVFEPTRTRT